jgi:CheY-like chemotaxis protein
MDIQMPGLDGYETTKLIRKIGSDYAKNIPIVALTANTFATIDAKARHCGMNDIIVKPIELEKLTKLFHKFFNKRM